MPASVCTSTALSEASHKQLVGTPARGQLWSSLAGLVLQAHECSQHACQCLHQRCTVSVDKHGGHETAVTVCKWLCTCVCTSAKGATDQSTGQHSHESADKGQQSTLTCGDEGLSSTSCSAATSSEQLPQHTDAPQQSAGKPFYAHNCPADRSGEAWLPLTGP